MATGQTLLDTMEMLNQELQLQSGESDVTRGLVALNRAQNHLEAMAAGHGRSLQSTTAISQTANVHYTARPAGLLRIDRIQLLDSNNRPLYNLDPDKRAGGNAIGWSWPLSLTAGSGKPYRYSYDRTNFYWTPIPDAANNLLVYGLVAASAITASGTFAYDDVLILPLAGFAVRLLRAGVDDAVQDVGTIAQETFGPVLKTLSLANRDLASGLEYRRSHSA